MKEERVRNIEKGKIESEISIYNHIYTYIYLTFYYIQSIGERKMREIK